jgi:hypothetical protein
MNPHPPTLFKINFNTISYTGSSDGSHVRFPSGERDVLFSETSIPILKPFSSSVQWLMGSPFPGVKPSRHHESEHWSPSSAEDANGWSCAATPPCCFLARTGKTLCLPSIMLRFPQLLFSSKLFRLTFYRPLSSHTCVIYTPPISVHKCIHPNNICEVCSYETTHYQFSSPSACWYFIAPWYW